MYASHEKIKKSLVFRKREYDITTYINLVANGGEVIVFGVEPNTFRLIFLKMKNGRNVKCISITELYNGR